MKRYRTSLPCELDSSALYTFMALYIEAEETFCTFTSFGGLFRGLKIRRWWGEIFVL